MNFICVHLWFAGSLSAFVYQHSITPLSLPLRLVLPTEGQYLFLCSKIIPSINFSAQSWNFLILWKVSTVLLIKGTRNNKCFYWSKLFKAKTSNKTGFWPNHITGPIFYTITNQKGRFGRTGAIFLCNMSVSQDIGRDESCQTGFKLVSCDMLTHSVQLLTCYGLTIFQTDVMCHLPSVETRYDLGRNYFSHLSSE